MFVRLSWVLLLAVFFLKAFLFLDPDFGWHLRTGEQITSKGFLLNDQFSYTSFDTPFIDHEWLTDLTMYNLYTLIGVAGLAFIWSLLALFAVWLVTKTKDKHSPVMIPILLSAGLILSQYGIRPQVISWLFFALLFVFLRNWGSLKSAKILIAPMFLLWANMHGEFLFGLLIFASFILLRSIRKKECLPVDAGLVFVSFASTLINPYGIKLWREVVETFIELVVRQEVNEWEPGFMLTNPIIPIVIGLTGALLSKSWKSIHCEIKIPYLITLILSAVVVIAIPVSAIFSPVIIAAGFKYLDKSIKDEPIARARMKTFKKALILLTLLMFILSGVYQLIGAYEVSENKYYPITAVGFIKKDIPEGEIFSHYNWGGYLIWKLPEKKVFVDGRMTHWSGIMDTFSKTITDKTTRYEVFGRYNINTVLWPISAKDGFIGALKKENWNVIYQDKVSVVLSRTQY